MTYLTENYPLPVEVQGTLDLLRSRNIYAYLAGGAVRDMVLGHTPKDYDIFIISESPDETLVMDSLIRELGFEQQHQASYDSEGYLCDYRKDSVNIVIYSDHLYFGIGGLVLGFDLNLNMWLYDDVEEDELQNLANWSPNDPIEVKNRNKSLRVQARITKFKERYPELDWSRV